MRVAVEQACRAFHAGKQTNGREVAPYFVLVIGMPCVGRCGICIIFGMEGGREFGSVHINSRKQIDHISSAWRLHAYTLETN
jgi:hypothetical protein